MGQLNYSLFLLPSHLAPREVEPPGSRSQVQPGNEKHPPLLQMAPITNYQLPITTAKAYN
jgi:hypothetical protein